MVDPLQIFASSSWHGHRAVLVEEVGAAGAGRGGADDDAVVVDRVGGPGETAKRAQVGELAVLPEHGVVVAVGVVGAADDLQEFDLGAGTDFYSLPNLIKTMRTNRYSLVDEILTSPLLTLK